MTKTRAAPNVPICTPKTAKSSHPQTPLHRILSREKWQFSAVDFSISPSEQLRRGESNLIAWLLLAPGLMRNWPMVRAPIRHASPYVDHIWDQSLLTAIILIVFCCWNVYLLGKSERTPISPLLASQTQRIKVFYALSHFSSKPIYIQSYTSPIPLPGYKDQLERIICPFWGKPL